MNRGHYFVDKKSYRKALVSYLITAMVGEQQGFLNAGIIADFHKPFTERDIDYNNLPRDLEEDPVYRIVRARRILPYVNLWNFLFAEFFDVLSPLPLQQRYDVLRALLEFPRYENLTISNYLAFKCFSLSIQDYTYSSLRLGDFYYYGIYNEQNFTQAKDYYLISAEFDQNEYFSQQSYLNLGKFRRQSEEGGRGD